MSNRDSANAVGLPVADLYLSLGAYIEAAIDLQNVLQFLLEGYPDDEEDDHAEEVGDDEFSGDEFEPCGDETDNSGDGEDLGTRAGLSEESHAQHRADNAYFRAEARQQLRQLAKRRRQMRTITAAEKVEPVP